MKESQELFSGLGARPHASQHAAGGRCTAGLLHTTHDHAKMGRFHDNTDTAGLQDFGYGESDLLGQALLNLQSAGEHFGQAGQFRKTEDTAIRDVSDMHLPHMVSTIRGGHMQQ